MRRRILSMILMAMFLLQGSRAFADPRELTLEECIQIAIAQNPVLRAASADLRVSEARAAEAHAPLEPSVSLFYNWTRQKSPLGAPVRTSFGAFQAQPLLLNFYRDGITLNHLIYDGQKTSSLFKGARALSEATRSQYRRLVQSLRFNTTRAFYALLASRKLAKVAEANVKNAEEHSRLAQASYKAGLAARADVVFAEVPVATARLNLTRARQVEESAQASLDRILSFDVNTELFLRDELTEKPYDVTLEEAQVEALRNREEIKGARSLVESAKAQLESAHGSYFPVLSAFASYGYVDYVAQVVPRNLGYSYGLQASWNVFNGNLQSSQVAETRAALEKNQALLESTKQDVALDVKDAFLLLRSAAESVDEARVELAKAEENLRLVEGQYRVGVVPILNLLDAQVSKTQAETHLINALSDYHTAIARLELAMGR